MAHGAIGVRLAGMLTVLAGVCPSLRAQDIQREYIWLGGRIIAIENLGNAPPTLISVNPTSGTGSAATFTVIAEDANGYADISSIGFHLSSAGPTKCEANYVRQSARLRLRLARRHIAACRPVRLSRIRAIARR